MRLAKSAILLLCVHALWFCPARMGLAAEIGDSVATFALSTHHGRDWSLDEISDREVVVLAFLGTECPLVKLYGPRLVELQEQFESKRVAIVGINSNKQDSMTELTAYANRYGINFPLLKDVGNRVADAVGAVRTPEVFVLDRKRTVRYRGRIDDQYGVGYSRDDVQRKDLAIAIQEVLDGGPVTVPETEAVGCHIGRWKQIEPKGPITYSNQIAKIFNQRCVQCHRDGELAPFTLTSYDDVLGWEDTILEVIDDNRMPPWFANPDHGRFENDARLSDEEKATIFEWVENGMPEGDPKELPPAPEFVTGWRIPEPDEIFHMDEKPFRVPADGVVDYEHFVVDPGWDEDKYIVAAEARPGNNAVVHHILVYILPDGQRGPDLRKILVGYAPGSTPVDLKDGAAIKVSAGSRLLFQMHYTPNGYEQEDRSYAGVRFIDKADVKQIISGNLVFNGRFRIPPNEPNHVVTKASTVREDQHLLSMTPHMHLRGKAFRYEAKYPDGTEEILLDVPKYDFNWQLKYTLSEPKLLPRGTRMVCTAVYDNSEQNLVNPNPNESVSYGEQSWEEMMIGFYETVPAGTTEEPLLSSDVKHDPSGEWSWMQDFGRGRGSKVTLSLKLKDQQLSGSFATFGQTMKIEQAVVQGDEITFSFDLPQGPGMRFDFNGKVTPDALQGKMTLVIESVGETKDFPWEARRNSEK